MDIEAIAAAWSGVPVQRLSSSESTMLATLEDVLREGVIGQEEAGDLCQCLTTLTTSSDTSGNRCLVIV
jgi:ATP-dependent Clp protease ATP-binding subunit ClpA